METAVFSPFVRLIKEKKTDDLRNRHVDHARSQGEVSVGRIDDSSDGSVESSGGMENGTGGCAWVAHPMAPVPLAAVVAPQCAGDCGQPPSVSSLVAPRQQIVASLL